MTDSVPKFERLMNLVSFLLASSEPVPFSSIRKQVIGYNDLAREDAVEKRFDRDKKELREIGIPVEYIASDERGREGYYIPREQYFHHELQLTGDEAALLTVLGNAARGSNDAVSANLRAALLKMTIDAPVPEELQVAIAKNRVLAFSRGKKDRAIYDNLEKIVRAVVNRKTIKFDYKRPEDRKAARRQLHPYGVGYRDGEWYVVGEDQDRSAIRQFRLSRMTGKLDVTRARGREFDIPPGFDIEKHLEIEPWEFDEGVKEEWAKILFDEEVAWMVEDALPPGRKFERRSDGRGVLSLKVRKSARTHQRLLGYLSAYSGQCAVLSPAWLRKQAIEHLTELRERYE